MLHETWCPIDARSTRCAYSLSATFIGGVVLVDHSLVPSSSPSSTRGISVSSDEFGQFRIGLIDERGREEKEEVGVKRGEFESVELE